MTEHYRRASGLGCGCDAKRSYGSLSAADSAPMPECQCDSCASRRDDDKRAVLSDVLLLISIGTALYAILKGKT